MGMRINYRIGTLPSAILFSNSHSATEDPEAVFRAAVREHGHAVSALVRTLLNTVYATSHGQHRAGDPMFTVDLHPGDRERVLTVDYIGNPPVIRARGARRASGIRR